MRGVPLWGTLVALAEGENVLAGAAYFPAVDEMVVAAQGAGCLWNGRPARVSGVSRLSEALVLTTDARIGHSRASGGARRSLRDVRAWSAHGATATDTCCSPPVAPR